MADPMTPDEMAAQLDQSNREAEARRLASQFLASQGIAGYSAPPPNQSVGPAPIPNAPPGPPTAQPIPTDATPPPPVQTSGGWEGAKKGALQGLKNVGAMALGPAGALAAGMSGVSNSVSKPPGGAPPPATAADNTPAGPPAPPPPVEEPPIMVGNYGSGGPVTPAGMFPDSESVAVHQGRPVPGSAKRAYNTATGLEIKGAEQQSAADKEYQTKLAHTYELKAAAADQAATNIQLTQARKQELVNARMQQIEALNKEATASIDPVTDRGAAATMLGALAIGFGAFGSALTGGPNTAANMINASIDRQIQTALANRKAAGDRADRARSLLDLQIEQLGDEAKGVEAYKLALYDSAKAKAEQYAAEHGIASSDANLNQLIAAIGKSYGDTQNKIALQEDDDINRSATERWHSASGGGGSGPKFESAKHAIFIPASDGTGETGTYVSVPDDVHKELAEMQGQTNQLVSLNKRAIADRKALREVTSEKYISEHPKDAMVQAATLRKRLEGYNNDRAALAEKAKDPNSVVRDAEFNRALSSGVDYTAGVLGRNSVGTGDVDKLIESNSNYVQQMTDQRLRGAGGQVVKHGVQRTREGYINNVWVPTGQIYNGRPVSPEKK